VATPESDACAGAAGPDVQATPPSATAGKRSDARRLSIDSSPVATNLRSILLNSWLLTSR
jgi:hypothetical protein